MLAVEESPACAERRASSGRSLEPARRAVAIGTFDGVHRGHRACPRQRRAPRLSLGRRHVRSASALVPRHRVQLLSTLERRLELLEDVGIEDVLVLPFDDDLAALARRSSPSRFCAQSGPKSSLPATGSASGSGRTGDLALLERLGFDVRRVPLVDNVSSSHIRPLLTAGDVAQAAQLLGRPAEVEGTS